MYLKTKVTIIEYQIKKMFLYIFCEIVCWLCEMDIPYGSKTV